MNPKLAASYHSSRASSYAPGAIRRRGGQTVVEYLLMIATSVGVIIVFAAAFRVAMPRLLEGILFRIVMPLEATTERNGEEAGKKQEADEEVNDGYKFAGFHFGAHTGIAMYKQDQGKPALTSLTWMTGTMGLLPKAQ